LRYYLKILKEAGLIERRRKENRICYRMADDSVIQLLKDLFKGENRDD